MESHLVVVGEETAAVVSDGAARRTWRCGWGSLLTVNLVVEAEVEMEGGFVTKPKVQFLE